MGTFNVYYAITVDAETPYDAASLVYEIMLDSESIPPIFDVIDFHSKERVIVDLSN